MIVERATILEAPEYRVEGRDKVTGRARYAADVSLPGMLWAAFLASPHPHARIRAIETSEACRVPGVRAVLTGAHVRPARFGRRLLDWPVLAWDRVRFVGDRVAAVAAETRAQAEAAAAAIAVDYEELPAVLDPEAALAPDAPVLHEDREEHAYLGGTRPPVPHPNVQGYALHEHGDVANAMARAARVFEHVFETARTHQGYIEPRASLVWLEGEIVHVVSTNKAPFALRDQMAKALGIAAERIVVDAGHIGGDFGGKGLSLDEFALYFLARATGRPVKTVMTYADDLTSTNTRHAARIRLRTGVDRDGNIVAHEGRVLFDGGAYAAGKPVATILPGEALLTLAGYRVPNARVEALAVYTNTVPAGHARAPGQPQNAFAAESHVDLIARAIGMDPLEFRLRNAIRAGDVDVNGERWESSMVPAVLQMLRRESGWGAARSAGRGRGVALGCRPSGHGKASLILQVTPDGQVEVFTAVSDQGGGAHTMLQRTVAAALEIAPERVRVRRGTTAETPYDPGVGGSRVTPVHGNAALAAARALRERLAALAPGAPIDVALARAAEDRVRVVGEHDYSRGSENYASYACVVDIEVDRETGAIRPVGATLVADIGTVINPVALRGQLEGGFVFGLGQALMEDLRVEGGRVTTAHLGDYKLPTIADVPPLRTILLTDDPGPGPFGAKSVGELSNPGPGPAVANAVHDAVGARVTSLPITAERVLAALAHAER